MGDLYASADADDATRAPAELTRLKALIDRSTAYYRAARATKSLDVSHDEWDKATGDRYLKLAEDNYEHFAPNTLFTDAVARERRSGNTGPRGRTTTGARSRRRRGSRSLPENRNAPTCRSGR